MNIYKSIPVCLEISFTSASCTAAVLMGQALGIFVNDGHDGMTYVFGKFYRPCGSPVYFEP